MNVFIEEVILNLLIIILAAFIVLWFLLSFQGRVSFPVYSFRGLTGNNRKDKKESEV